MTATVINLPVTYDETAYSSVCVAQLGHYLLLRVADAEFLLTGPDQYYPPAWLDANLPAGVEWFTRWLPGVGFRMSITC